MLGPRNSPRIDAVLSKQRLVVVAFDSGLIVNKRTPVGHPVLVQELVGSGFRFAPAGVRVTPKASSNRRSRDSVISLVQRAKAALLSR